MSDLLSRIKKTSVIKQTTVLSESSVYSDKAITSTPIKALNIALSGKVDGGLCSGVTTIAGPSKHFKSLLGLIMAGAYLKQHPDSAMIFYDSEFGTPDNYFDACGVDRSRVIHIPVKNIEELKFDMVKQLSELKKGDNVFFFLDSIGNIASKKEVDDALNDKSVADMTRAKAVKSLFRMVTPYLTLNDIPFVNISHTYKTQEMFSKQIVSGGTGITYSSDNILMMGRRQEKEGTEIIGYNFIINVEKSRFVKEKSKIPLSVTYKDGVSKYSGLIDMAIEGGYVYKPKNGWYRGRDPNAHAVIEGLDKSGADLHVKSYRLGETDSAEFWDPIFNTTDFKSWIERRYSLGQISLLDDESDEVEVVESEDNVESVY